MQKEIKKRQPVLLSDFMRTAISINGLPEKQRAQLHCIQYAKREMSEEEFIELYNDGSDVYKTFCEDTIFVLRITNTDWGLGK